MIFTVLGLFAAALFIFADSIYLKDTITGKTHPQRTAWAIGFLMSLIAFANQLASGANSSLWTFGASVIMIGAIFLASLKNGTGGHGKHDYLVVAVALAGIGLWVAFEDPIFSVVTSAGIFVALMTLNFAKAKTDPESETKLTWLLASISGALNTIAVGELDFQLLLLPFTAFILQAYMSYLLYRSPKKPA